MPRHGPWRKKLFVAMARNAANPAEYFRLPDDQTAMGASEVAAKTKAREFERRAVRIRLLTFEVGASAYGDVPVKIA
jgi:hypothetical protein